MSLPVITMLQFLDEPAQLQKFFDLRGKLVTCFSVKGLTLGQRIERFELTRERIAISENAVIRFLHLEDVEITAFRAIQRSRLYRIRSKLDAAETFQKLVEALPGGRLEPALRAQIETFEHGLPADLHGDLIARDVIEAEFRRDEEAEEPTMPAYHFGQPFAAARVPGHDLPVFKGLDPVPVGHVRVPDPAQVLESFPVQPPEKPRPFRVIHNDPAQVERDNRFGHHPVTTINDAALRADPGIPAPEGYRRLSDGSIERLPEAHTMGDKNREARGAFVGLAAVAASVVAVCLLLWLGG